MRNIDLEFFKDGGGDVGDEADSQQELEHLRHCLEHPMVQRSEAAEEQKMVQE